MSIRRGTTIIAGSGQTRYIQQPSDSSTVTVANRGIVRSTSQQFYANTGSVPVDVTSTTDFSQAPWQLITGGGGTAGTDFSIAAGTYTASSGSVSLVKQNGGGNVVIDGLGTGGGSSLDTVVINRGGSDTGTISGTTITLNLQNVGDDNVHADWNQTSSSNDSFINNKPFQTIGTGLAVTNGVLTATGSGEDNVQSNWTETDTGDDSYIENKPFISIGTGLEVVNGVLNSTGSGTGGFDIRAVENYATPTVQFDITGTDPNNPVTTQEYVDGGFSQLNDNPLTFPNVPTIGDNQSWEDLSDNRRVYSAVIDRIERQTFSTWNGTNLDVPNTTMVVIHAVPEDILVDWVHGDGILRYLGLYNVGDDVNQYIVRVNIANTQAYVPNVNAGRTTIPTTDNTGDSSILWEVVCDLHEAITKTTDTDGVVTALGNEDTNIAIAYDEQPTYVGELGDARILDPNYDSDLAAALNYDTVGQTVTVTTSDEVHYVSGDHATIISDDREAYLIIRISAVGDLGTTTLITGGVIGRKGGGTRSSAISRLDTGLAEILSQVDSDVVFTGSMILDFITGGGNQLIAVNNSGSVHGTGHDPDDFITVEFLGDNDNAHANAFDFDPTDTTGPHTYTVPTDDNDHDFTVGETAVVWDNRDLSKFFIGTVSEVLDAKRFRINVTKTARNSDDITAGNGRAGSIASYWRALAESAEADNINPFNGYTISGTPSTTNSVPKWTAANTLAWSEDEAPESGSTELLYSYTNANGETVVVATSEAAVSDDAVSAYTDATRGTVPVPEDIDAVDAAGDILVFPNRNNRGFVIATVATDSVAIVGGLGFTFAVGEPMVLIRASATDSTSVTIPLPSVSDLTDTDIESRTETITLRDAVDAFEWQSAGTRRNLDVRVTSTHGITRNTDITFTDDAGNVGPFTLKPDNVEAGNNILNFEVHQAALITLIDGLTHTTGRLSGFRSIADEVVNAALTLTYPKEAAGENDFLIQGPSGEWVNTPDPQIEQHQDDHSIATVGYVKNREPILPLEPEWTRAEIDLGQETTHTDVTAANLVADFRTSEGGTERHYPIAFTQDTLTMQVAASEASNYTKGTVVRFNFNDGTTFADVDDTFEFAVSGTSTSIQGHEDVIFHVPSDDWATIRSYANQHDDDGDAYYDYYFYRLYVATGADDLVTSTTGRIVNIERLGTDEVFEDALATTDNLEFNGDVVFGGQGGVNTMPGTLVTHEPYPQTTADGPNHIRLNQYQANIDPDSAISVTNAGASRGLMSMAFVGTAAQITGSTDGFIAEGTTIRIQQRTPEGTSLLLDRFAPDFPYWEWTFTDTSASQVETAPENHVELLALEHTHGTLSNLFQHETGRHDLISYFNIQGTAVADTAVYDGGWNVFVSGTHEVTTTTKVITDVIEVEQGFHGDLSIANQEVIGLGTFAIPGGVMDWILTETGHFNINSNGTLVVNLNDSQDDIVDAIQSATNVAPTGAWDFTGATVTGIGDGANAAETYINVNNIGTFVAEITGTLTGTALATGDNIHRSIGNDHYLINIHAPADGSVIKRLYDFTPNDSNGGVVGDLLYTHTAVAAT